MPPAAYTDLSVLFSAVAVAIGRAFGSFEESAERTVVEVERFFAALLGEMTATRCTDLADLSASRPGLRDFLRGFLSSELPAITSLPVLSLCQRAALATTLPAKITPQRLPREPARAPWKRALSPATAPAPAAASSHASCSDTLLKRRRLPPATAEPPPVPALPVDREPPTPFDRVIEQILPDESVAPTPPLPAELGLTFGGDEPEGLPVAFEPPWPSPVSALQLHHKWLDLVLSGDKVWEIRSTATHKRERIALAQAPLVRRRRYYRLPGTPTGRACAPRARPPRSAS